MPLNHDEALVLAKSLNCEAKSLNGSKFVKVRENSLTLSLSDSGKVLDALGIEYQPQEDSLLLTKPDAINRLQKVATIVGWRLIRSNMRSAEHAGSTVESGGTSQLKSMNSSWKEEMMAFPDNTRDLQRQFSRDEEISFLREKSVALRKPFVKPREELTKNGIRRI